MEIKKAKYLTSSVKIETLIDDEIAEFAFVGKSNVGKSTLLNAITNVKNLAKASSTPGMTQMVNYFLINEQFRFVDLPGYGFAKTAKAKKNVWEDIISYYLETSQNLKLIFFLVDIRHEPTSHDLQMVKYLDYNALPYIVLATKADKLAKSKIFDAKMKIQKSLGHEVIPVSSETKFGIDKVLERIEFALCDEIKEEL